MRKYYTVTIAISICISACGETKKTQRVHSARSDAPDRRSLVPTNPAGKSVSSRLHYQDVDGDRESERIVKVIGDGHYDSDETGIIYFGQNASNADRRAVISVVRRYHAAAAADNGAKACDVIYTLLTEAIPEDYGQPPGPPSLRGKTCAVVLTKLFKQPHGRHIDVTVGRHVIGVRVKGNRGLALMSSGTRVESSLPVRRERGVWKVSAINANEIG